MKSNREYIYGRVKVVQREDFKWGVTDLFGNVIVPFGKYDWIDRFDSSSGFARIKEEQIPSPFRPRRSKWGLINTQGEEVVPVEYDGIWKFDDANGDSFMLEKGDVVIEFHCQSNKLTYYPSRDMDMEVFMSEIGRFTEYEVLHLPNGSFWLRCILET